MKILITGSKGYIGVALYNALKDRYKVVGLSKEDIDLTDLNQVKEFPIFIISFSFIKTRNQY